jgi:hypothetical protein
MTYLLNIEDTLLHKKRQYYIIKAIQIKKGETNGGEQEK